MPDSVYSIEIKGPEKFQFQLEEGVSCFIKSFSGSIKDHKVKQLYKNCVNEILILRVGNHNFTSYSYTQDFAVPLWN